MLRRGPPKCAAGYLVAGIFFVCYLNQTEASALTKSEHPAVEDGQKKANKTLRMIQEGVIVFGKGLNAPANGGNDAAYEADAPGGHKGRVLDVGLKEALWKRMSPSLLCGWDQMKFRAVGPDVKLFSMDQDPPLPLSQVPSSCGYNMHRNPFGLVMHVPYDGCYIVQEGESYVLPLRWHGLPVTLKCPKHDSVPQNSTIAPPIVPEMYQGDMPLPPYGYPWYWPPNPQEPASTTAAPQEPMPPGLFPPYMRYWQRFQNYPYQTMTASPTDDPDAQGLFPPYMRYWQRFQKYPYQTTTASPTDDPDDQGPFPPYMRYWQRFQNYPYQTTTAAPTEAPMPQGPYLPWMFYWHYLQERKETAPTTPPPQPYPWFNRHW